LFGAQTQQPGQVAQSMGAMGGPMMMEILPTTEDQEAESTIRSIVGQVQSMVEPQSKTYSFRACMYEKMDPKWTSAQKDHIKNHVLPST